MISQANLLASISLRRRAKVAALEARAHDAALAARLLAGDAVELGRYRPRSQCYEKHLIFAIYDIDNGPIPVVIDTFAPDEI